MSLLLNSLVVLDPTSKYHNSLVNILISSDGKISKISRKKINEKVKRIINCEKKKVTLGWMDFSANFCDPGYEYKEDIISATKLSSNSGFTDVLIQSGADKVYAVDVGTNQLHEKLKKNNKIISLEKTNARYLKKDQFEELIDIMVCDVSFISLKKVIEPNFHLLKKDSIIIALIKPQFESRKNETKK